MSYVTYKLYVIVWPFHRISKKSFYHLAGVLILMELIGLLKYKSPDSKHNCQEVTMIKPIHALIWVLCKVFVFDSLLIAGFFIARAIM